MIRRALTVPMLSDHARQELRAIAGSGAAHTARPRPSCPARAQLVDERAVEKTQGAGDEKSHGRRSQKLSPKNSSSFSPTKSKCEESSPGYTPSQKVWFMVRSVLVSSPTTRCSTPWK